MSSCPTRSENGEVLDPCAHWWPEGALTGLGAGGGGDGAAGTEGVAAAPDSLGRRPGPAGVKKYMVDS